MCIIMVGLVALDCSVPKVEGLHGKAEFHTDSSGGSFVMLCIKSSRVPSCGGSAT